MNVHELEQARRLEDAARLVRRAVEAGELSPDAARWYLLGREVTRRSGDRTAPPPARRLGDPRG